MKKPLFLLALFTSFSVYAQVGINTETPQSTLHVNGALQVTNELNVGGDDATAGNAGTSGQILTSNGRGAAPDWTTLEDAGIVSLSCLAFNSVDSNSNYAANHTFTVLWDSTPKIDNTKLTYNFGTGKFTVVKAGYYQVLTSTHLNMTANLPADPNDPFSPYKGTSGTGITRIYKNTGAIGTTSISYGERTNDVYHTTAATAFFDEGDIMDVRMVMTRNFKIFGTGTFVSVTYLGQ